MASQIDRLLLQYVSNVVLLQYLPRTAGVSIVLKGLIRVLTCVVQQDAHSSGVVAEVVRHVVDFAPTIADFANDDPTTVFVVVLLSRMQIILGASYNK